jgi:uncharacterized protein YecE (DUF72 family)
MKIELENLQWMIGCSGFYYTDWKEIFYPEKLAKSKWLEYYSEKFETVEINATFYRIMKPSFFENLYKRTPSNFQFSIKASRIVTHYNKFNNVKEHLSEFYLNIANGLKEKLGCVLFQLPPNYIYKKESLDKIIEHLDPSFNNVVEFRHPSWWDQSVFRTLEHNNICFCTTSYPGIPDDIIINGHLVYIRLHGVPVLYRSPYSENYLRNIISVLTSKKDIKKVFWYFDNTASGSAIKNAFEAKVLLAQNH